MSYEFADIKEEVHAKAGPNASPSQLTAAFAETVLEKLEQFDEVENFEVFPKAFRLPSKGPLPAAELTGFGGLSEDAPLDLYLARHDQDADASATFGAQDMETQFNLLKGFMRRVLKNHDECQVPGIDDLRTRWDTCRRVRLFILNSGTLSMQERERSSLADYEYENKTVSLHLYDLRKLGRIASGDHLPIEIDFEQNYGRRPVPCLVQDDALGEYTTYILLVPGETLSKIYGQYSLRLLERNVRVSLGGKGKINRGMLKTIETESHRFLAYNNGLSCTAGRVDVRPMSEAGMVLLRRIHDFQIVNGGQTTTSLYDAAVKGLSLNNVMVQMKLTVVNDPELHEEVLDHIGHYANSQNAIKTSDLLCRGPLHVGLERLSEAIVAPPRSGVAMPTRWYYERKRGAYERKKSQCRGPKLRQFIAEYPRRQVITPAVLAKLDHAWEGRPDLVAKGAQKNFVEWAANLTDAEANGTSLKVDECVFRGIVARQIIVSCAEALHDELKLGEARAQVAAYAFACLAIKSEKRVDLGRIWTAQAVGESLKIWLRTAVSKCHRQIKHYYDDLATENAKQEKCWKAIRDGLDAWESVPEDALCGTETPAVAGQSTIARGWDDLRELFRSNDQTLDELGRQSGLRIIKTFRDRKVSELAAMDYETLTGQKGWGPKVTRQLFKILKSASPDRSAASDTPDGPS